MFEIQTNFGDLSVGVTKLLITFFPQSNIIVICDSAHERKKRA